jgi:hypothetical protein
MAKLTKDEANVCLACMDRIEAHYYRSWLTRAIHRKQLRFRVQLLRLAGLQKMMPVKVESSYVNCDYGNIKVIAHNQALPRRWNWRPKTGSG